MLIVGSIRSALEVQEIRFKGGLVFDDNGTITRTYNQPEIQYVGLPSKEIDDAWNFLIKGK